MSRWAPHPVTLRQLQYALAVAEFGSFRRAADACAIAQPSLSSQIAQLESVLGVRLFERLTRGVVVTAAGRAVLERASEMLLAADDLVAAAMRVRDPDSGELHIGVIPTVAPYLLPEVASALHAEYPRLQFFWEEEKTHALVERIESGSLDAGILALDADTSQLAHVELGRDAFFLAVPSGHKLARGRGPAQLSQLDGETVLVLADGHCFRDQALDVCHRAGAEEASVRATSLSTLAQMVASGTGITLLPHIALRTENRARALVTRSFGARGPARTLALAWRKTTPIGPSLVALGAVIRKTIAPLVG